MPAKVGAEQLVPSTCVAEPLQNHGALLRSTSNVNAHALLRCVLVVNAAATTA